MVPLRRHAALLCSLLVAHRGTFVNAHNDASTVSTLKITVDGIRNVEREGFSHADVYVCVYLTDATTLVPSKDSMKPQDTEPIHLEGARVVGCTTAKAAQHVMWDNAVFYIPQKDINATHDWLQVHVWDEDIRSLRFLNTAPDFVGGFKKQIVRVASPTTEIYPIVTNGPEVYMTLSFEETPSAEIFDRSCMSFSDIDDTLAPGAHEALKGGTIPGSDNRFSYTRNYPGFPLMLRKLCPSLTFLSARPLETQFGGLENLSTNGINKWPQLAEIDKTNPFYHVAYLGGTITGSVEGTGGCQLQADSDNQKQRDGCAPFATDKVTNYHRFMTRFPQYKNVFLFGDNGQGDFSAWTQIVGAPRDGIHTHAYIRETLVDECQDGRCVYRLLNATTGYKASMALQRTPGGVTVVRGWRCLLDTLTKTASAESDRYFTQEQRGAIEEVMKKEIDEIGADLARYGGAGVLTNKKKQYFEHWVEHEHTACWNKSETEDTFAANAVLEPRSSSGSSTLQPPFAFIFFLLALYCRL